MSDEYNEMSFDQILQPRPWKICSTVKFPEQPTQMFLSLKSFFSVKIRFLIFAFMDPTNIDFYLPPPLFYFGFIVMDGMIFVPAFIKN